MSYGTWSPWVKNYCESFYKILIDSGAFSVYNSGKTIDREKYFRWSLRFKNIADQVACLDSVIGDTDETIANCEYMPEGWGFPTFHESDPWDSLPEMVELAYKHGGWIGLGLIPPRTGKDAWVRRAVTSIPEDLHIHGWACREYLYLPQIKSADSTNWFLDAMAVNKKLPWLNYGECLEIIIKRYQRESKMLEEPNDDETLFGLERH